MRIVHSVVVALLVTLSSAAQSDRVTTADGRDVHGAVTGVFREGVVVTSDGADRLVPWARIVLVTSAAPVAVDFGAGNRAVGHVVAYELGERIAVDTDVLGVLRIPLDSLVPRPEVVTDEPVERRPATPLEPRDWTGSASFFGSITRGNAEVLDIAFEIKASRRWERDSLELGAFAVRGVSAGRTTKDAQRAQGLLRHYYEDDFYSYASLELGRDTVQQVSLRMLANVGAGVILWKESDDELFALEGGIGYRHESFENDGEERNDGTGRIALVYKDVFFERGKYDQLLEVIVPATEPGALLARFEAGLTLPIADSWSLENSLRLTYRGDTPDGTKSLDLFLGVGLKYTF